MSYDGWVIQARYFRETLGDIDPDEYEAAWLAEIESAYPGATIEMESIPDGCGYPVRVYAPDDTDTRDEVKLVESLGESAWLAICNK